MQLNVENSGDQVGQVCIAAVYSHILHATGLPQSTCQDLQALCTGYVIFSKCTPWEFN